MEIGLGQFFFGDRSARTSGSEPNRAYLIYALIGLFWIVLSDRALLWLQVSEDIVHLTAFQTMKGWVFVCGTALGFYLLGRRRAQDLQNANQNMICSREIARATYDAIWRGTPQADNFEILHYKGDTAVADTLKSLGADAVHPEDLPAQFQAWSRATQEKKPYVTRVRVKVGDGYRYFENMVFPIFDHSGNIVEWLGACRDIDDAVQNETKLRRSEELLRLAAEAGGIGVWDWDIERNTLRVSEEMRRQHGRDITSPTQLKAFINAEDYPRVHTVMLAAKRECAPYSAEYRIDTPDQGTRWILNKGAAFSGESAGARRMVGISMDISGLKAAEQRLRYLAYQDALTDLPNRRFGEEYLVRSVSEVGPTQNVAVCLLDIDYFGVLNDTQGAAVGDVLLRAIAKRIRATLREGERVCRYSADVFLLILPRISNEELPARLETLKVLLGQPFEVGANRVFISMTGGVAVYNRDAHNAQELLRAARTALHRAKESNRGQIGQFDDSMLARNERFEQIRNALLSALPNEEFSLHFQPQLDLRTGENSGFEALLRWHSASLGAVSPAEFIPVAECMGLIVDIDRYVLDTLLTQIRTWQREGHAVGPVGFNLSPVCLERPGNAERIRELVSRHGLQPDQLLLEVTETAIIHDADVVSENLTKLGNYGFLIAIDDFGTGYSSLENLHRFPIHKVKIDKVFIQQIECSDSHANMTRAIIHMAHDMGMEVIAEGVEKSSHYELLQVWGCDIVQGYHYGRPVPARQAAAFLSTAHSG